MLFIINKIFKRAAKFDDTHEFKPILAEIEESPVSPLGRTTFWILITIIVATLLWLYLGKVDIVVSARGIVIPEGEVKTLQPLDTGIVSKILVKEGDQVKRDQVLMEIDPSNVEPEMISAQKNLENLQLEIQRLKALTGNGSFGISGHSGSVKTQQDLYNSSLSSLNEQLENQQLEFNKISEQISSIMVEKSNIEALLKTSIEQEKRLKSVIDIIARDQYERISKETQNYKAELRKLDHKLEELVYKKAQVKKEISYIKANFKTTNLKELAEREKQAVQLVADAERLAFKNSKQKIVSPVDGYVDKLLIHTVGGVVTPAEKLIMVTPVDAPLMIKSTVLNKDIGFIRENMPVSVKIDTFNFQKYGLIEGKIKSISKNSIEHEKLGPVYEVYITPLTQTLMVEGKEEKISTGMTLSSEIKVGKRRIVEFFIYPLIKYLDEGISVR